MAECFLYSDRLLAVPKQLRPEPQMVGGREQMVGGQSSKGIFQRHAEGLINSVSKVSRIALALHSGGK